jgi:hypothetical protein
MRLLILASIALCLTDTAFAQEDTGHSVRNAMEACEVFLANDPRDPRFASGSGVCFGSIMVISQVSAIGCAEAFASGSSKTGWAILPEGMTVEAVAQLFVNWARAHPQSWGSPAGLGIRWSLYESYPCGG